MYLRAVFFASITLALACQKPGTPSTTYTKSGTDLILKANTTKQLYQAKWFSFSDMMWKHMGSMQRIIYNKNETYKNQMLKKDNRWSVGESSVTLYKVNKQSVGLYKSQYVTMDKETCEEEFFVQVDEFVMKPSIVINISYTDEFCNVTASCQKEFFPKEILRLWLDYQTGEVISYDETVYDLLEHGVTFTYDCMLKNGNNTQTRIKQVNCYHPKYLVRTIQHVEHIEHDNYIRVHASNPLLWLVLAVSLMIVIAFTFVTYKIHRNIIAEAEITLQRQRQRQRRNI